MSEKIETGGSAFPAPLGCGPYVGMTMRDYFAAKAMQALVSNDVLHEIWRDWSKGIEFKDECSVVHSYATVAYAMADAMLKARGVKNEQG